GALAGALVLGEAARHGGEGDRVVVAVAGAHAQGPVGSGLRHVGAAGEEARGGTRGDVAAAEQGLEEVLRARRRGGAILRSAVVLGELPEDRAALVAPVGRVALQTLQIAVEAVEIAAHALDVAVDVGALGRLAAEQEESRAFAPVAASDRLKPVELGLLLARRVLGALDLVGARRVAGAAVDHRELALEPDADLIRGRRSAVLRLPAV